MKKTSFITFRVEKIGPFISGCKILIIANDRNAQNKRCTYEWTLNKKQEGIYKTFVVCTFNKVPKQGYKTFGNRFFLFQVVNI